MSIENDDVKSFSREDTAHKLPMFWVLLFAGLIVWGVYYLYAYTPFLGGYTQEAELLESLKETVKIK